MCFSSKPLTTLLDLGRHGRGWDGWMTSLTRRTWVWVNSRNWWWTGRPGVLWFMGLQCRTWLSNWTELRQIVALGPDQIVKQAHQKFDKVLLKRRLSYSRIYYQWIFSHWEIRAVITEITGLPKTKIFTNTLYINTRWKKFLFLREKLASF